MGMSGRFTSVSANKLKALIDNPASVVEFLLKDSTATRNTIDVEKAWHGIHFLLTGEAWGGSTPLASAVFGGKEIGSQLSYGPARFLRPDEVKAIAQALAQLDAQQFRARFAPKAMTQAEVYPTIIWERDSNLALNVLTEHYFQLVDFYCAAAARNDGVLLWIF